LQQEKISVNFAAELAWEICLVTKTGEKTKEIQKEKNEAKQKLRKKI